MKTEIYITQIDNDKYFKQKLPTWRNGFCKILRNVTLEKDPYSVYGEGEFGTITVHGQKIVVVRSDLNSSFEIHGRASCGR